MLGLKLIHDSKREGGTVVGMNDIKQIEGPLIFVIACTQYILLGRCRSLTGQYEQTLPGVGRFWTLDITL